MQALSLVPTAPEEDAPLEQEERPSPYLQNSGVDVTITNAAVGTVRVLNRAYYRFRDILLEQKEIASDDGGRSLVIVELFMAFSCAMRIKRRGRGDCRDRDGNLILVDEKMGIMFIIARNEQTLLNVYDKSKGKDRGGLEP